MLFVQRVLIGDQERVILTRNGRFSGILGAGEHWIFGLGVQYERHSLTDPVFTSTWAAFLAKQERADTAEHLTLVETGDEQVAAIYFDGKFNRILPPGKRMLFWRGPVEVTARLFQIKDQPEVPKELVANLARFGAHAIFAPVDEGKTGLLYIDGRFARTLTAGSYAFWNAAASVRVEVVDLRRQTLEIPGQEILTRDKVSIRVNVWAEYQVADAVKAKQSVKDYADHLYRALQLAVRHTLGRRTLEEILDQKVDIDEAVAAGVRAEMAEFGVRVGGMALKDVILPGEMRAILNEVVTAEKQAQANLIRRREETAATRSLLNTAKLMEGNPLLVRLKEMETLEKIAGKVDKITVHGGFETLMRGMITLAEKE